MFLEIILSKINEIEKLTAFKEHLFIWNINLHRVNISIPKKVFVYQKKIFSIAKKFAFTDSPFIDCLLCAKNRARQ